MKLGCCNPHASMKLGCYLGFTCKSQWNNLSKIWKWTFTSIIWFRRFYFQIENKQTLYLLLISHLRRSLYKICNLWISIITGGPRFLFRAYISFWLQGSKFIIQIMYVYITGYRSTIDLNICLLPSLILKESLNVVCYSK